MMKLADIADAAGFLGRLLTTGETLADAAVEMANMQPKHADFWAQAGAAIRNGRPLSESLALVWPESLVATVRAGEDSGRLDSILLNVRETCELQMRLIKSASKLLRPVAILVVAVLVGIFFMAVLIPNIVRTMSKSSPQGFEPDALTRLAFHMESLWRAHGLALGAVTAVAVFALVRWIRSPEARDQVVNAVLSIPGLSAACRNIAFGLWARYLSLTVGAGVPLMESLKITAPVLPGSLRTGVEAMHYDLAVRNHSLSRASGEGLAEGDPRKSWPRFIVNAFRAGERTGQLDKEFEVASPALVDVGERQLNKVIEVANTAFIGLAAFCAGVPLLLIYQPIIRMIGSAH